MSDDFVIDASALLLALIGKTTEADALRKRLPTIRRHAPHLIDAEVGNVLRRHEREGRISPEEARSALGACETLVDHRYPHAGPLAELAWTRRSNITFYDALYVVLAAQLRIPLITADRRISRAPNLDCQGETV